MLFRYTLIPKIFPTSIQHLSPTISTSSSATPHSHLTHTGLTDEIAKSGLLTINEQHRRMSTNLHLFHGLDDHKSNESRTRQSLKAKAGKAKVTASTSGPSVDSEN